MFGPVGNLVNLQPGGWVGYNVTHVISANTSNVATAWGINQFGTNVTSAASAFVQVYSGADILLTLTPSKTKVASGASVSYLYNVSNTGETALTGAIVDDVFGPVGNLVNLQPGGWVGYNVTHVISANTSNVATAWGINQFGTNVTSAASAFVQVYSGAGSPEYSLSVNLVGSGFSTANGSSPYTAGDTVKLTAIPSAGWTFSGWSGD